MSDVEEPPSKMSKYTDLQYLDECEDTLDEGQEEWLSEGVLTDDDYNPASENQQINVNNETASQDTTAEDIEYQEHETEASPTDNGGQADAIETNTSTEQNIEDQLNSLDGVKSEHGISEDLNTFLIRKSDGKLLDVKVDASLEDGQADGQVDVTPKEEPTSNIKHDGLKDDGNDTDDLLRMLGDDNNINKKKKSLKMVKSEKIEEASSEEEDDDDEFIYERSKMRTLRLAKHALQMRQPATKAEPEEYDDSDPSTDEASMTMKRMFGVQRAAGARAQRHILQLNSHAPRPEPSVQKPIKQYTNKSLQQPKSILKSPASENVHKVANKPTNTKSVAIKAPTSKSGEFKAATLKSGDIKSVEIKTPPPFKPLVKSEAIKSGGRDTTFKAEQMDDILDEEFLEDDGLEVDELCSESEEDEEGEEDEERDAGERGTGQRIRRPERMDEEAFSDADSHTEDGSLYDELPSSDSDDMDDWFSLDIRAERAGDYLPQLGCKARSLLAAERGRVESRVATLRQSLAALTASARRQADQLRAAAMALAEIDDTLRAA